MSNGKRASQGEVAAVPNMISLKAQKAEESTKRLWLKFSSILARDSAAIVVEMFFWISLGLIFECSSPAALSEWRSKLSNAWNDLSFDVKARVEHDAKTGDYINNSLPAVFVQTTYRLFVDAFGPDDSSLFADHPEPLLGKLTCIVNYELFGFQLSPLTSRAARVQLYKKFVIDHPHLDQLKNQEIRMRQELLASNRDLFQGLVFGSVHSLPLDDIQLEHLRASRGRTDSDGLKPCLLDSVDGAQAGEEDTNARNKVLRHKTTLKLQEELNVERHQAELDEAAERLNSKYNDVLEGAGLGRFDSKVSIDASPAPDVDIAPFGMEDSVSLSPMSSNPKTISRRGSVRNNAKNKAA